MVRLVGSIHEATATKTKQFPLFTPDSCFTDDTVMMVAVAEVLLDSGDYTRAFHRYFHAYPDVGYGQQFKLWCELRRTKPYNSWGNGSAMRVGPIGLAFDRLEDVLAEAERSARVTHDHPEGIRGAKATAAAVFLARRQSTEKSAIAKYVEAEFGYDLSVPLKRVRRAFLFDVSCVGTVPWAIRAFLEADGYEGAIRNAISLGGDADTLACIAGAVAGAYYGVPADIATEAMGRLDDRLRKVVARFTERFGGEV
ncbi:MAG: ADP-ribosylglycohydrolase family protein [Planctomycetes bacterium]|nr:ADP-ribosylglycohydrolase family protein [Planctomycetota bacterium]